MKSSAVIVLAVAAIVPPAVVLIPDVAMAMLFLFRPVFFWFCFASALGWCALFNFFYARTEAPQRRRLFLLLPLLFFASIFPAIYALSGLGLLGYLDKIAPP